MKIIVVLEKYGGYCNRFFQSLHYHAYAIENDIIFFNFSMVGLLRFDNSLFYFLDKINNFFLSILSKLVKSLLGKNDICFYGFSSLIEFSAALTAALYPLSSPSKHIIISSKN